MDRESILNTIQDIGLCEDATERGQKLIELQDNLVQVFDSIDTDKTTIETLNTTIQSKDSKIDELQKANMDYFKRISSQNSEQDEIKNKTGLDPEEKVELRFEDLFDEKGMIK